MDFYAMLVPAIVVVFLIVFAVIIRLVGKDFAERSRNYKLPVLSVPARVVAKRTATSGSMSPSWGGQVTTSYFATLELASGERLEFALNGKRYGLLAEQDEGILTYQGSRYLGFERRGHATHTTP